MPPGVVSEVWELLGGDKDACECPAGRSRFMDGGEVTITGDGCGDGDAVAVSWREIGDVVTSGRGVRSRSLDRRALSPMDDWEGLGEGVLEDFGEGGTIARDVPLGGTRTGACVEEPERLLEGVTSVPISNEMDVSEAGGVLGRSAFGESLAMK